MNPNQQFIVELVGKCAYPVVIAAVGIVFILINKEALRDLVPRISSIGARGVKVVPPRAQQIAAPTVITESNGVNNLDRELSSSVGSALLDIRANAIYAMLDSQNLVSQDRETMLVRMLSAAQLRELWARTYLLIYGSQIDLVRKLNENPLGLPEQEVRKLYSIAKARYSETYASYPFESWILFLEATWLVAFHEGIYRATPGGAGFLRFLIQERFSFDRPG
jgi:hypothetical protein